MTTKKDDEDNMPGAAPKQRRKRNKKPKDMPKRPLSAYNLFFAEERERILSAQRQGIEQPDFILPDEEQSKREAASQAQKDGVKKKRAPVLFQALARCVGKRWNELSATDKKKYEAMAEEEMVKYRGKMEEYQRNVVVNTMAYPAEGKKRKPYDADNDNEDGDESVEKKRPASNDTKTDLNARGTATGGPAASQHGEMPNYPFPPGMPGAMAGFPSQQMAALQQQFYQNPPGANLLQASAAGYGSAGSVTGADTSNYSQFVYPPGLSSGYYYPGFPQFGAALQSQGGGGYGNAMQSSVDHSSYLYGAQQQQQSGMGFNGASQDFLARHHQQNAATQGRNPHYGAGWWGPDTGANAGQAYSATHYPRPNSSHPHHRHGPAAGSGSGNKRGPDSSAGE